ncbi:hypothetical protein BDZ45DRAFT_292136 [Acephala macrosclerotiorum]|nr:hypothetical protein BDZ45DRAFT_292136 [Acephala macrosclerotiorum]
MPDSAPSIASDMSPPLSPTTELAALRNELQLLKNHTIELSNIIQNQNSQITQFETYFNTERQNLATYQDCQAQNLQREQDTGSEHLRERDALLAETVRLEKRIAEENVECNAHIGDLTRQNQELKEVLEREIAEHRSSNADLQSSVSGIDASTQTDRDDHLETGSGTQISESTISVLVYNSETQGENYKQITAADYQCEMEKYQDLILQHSGATAQLKEDLAHAVKDAKAARASRDQALDAMEEMETAAEEALANGSARPEVLAANYLKQLKACQEELATKKKMGEAMSVAQREAAEACAERGRLQGELKKMRAERDGDDCEEKLKKCDNKLKKTFQRAEEGHARYEKAAQQVLEARRDRDALQKALDAEKAKPKPTAGIPGIAPLDDFVEDLLKCRAELAQLSEMYENSVNDSNAARLKLDQAMLEIERLKNDNDLDHCFNDLLKTREQLAKLSEMYEASIDEANAARLGMDQAMLEIERLKAEAEEATIDEGPLDGDCPERLNRCQANLAQCNADKEKLVEMYNEAVRETNEARGERDDGLEKLQKANANLEAMIRRTPDESVELRTCEERLMSLRAQLNTANANATTARAERDQAIEANNQSILDNESVTTVGSDLDILTSDGENDSPNVPLDDYDIKLEIAQTALDNSLAELALARRTLAERTAERNGAAFRVQVLEAESIESQNREIALQQQLGEEREGDSLAVTLEEELYDCGTNLEAMTEERDAALAEVTRLQVVVAGMEVDVRVIRTFSVNNRAEIVRLEGVVEDMEREAEKLAAEVEQQKYEVEKEHAEELERAKGENTAEDTQALLAAVTETAARELEEQKIEVKRLQADLDDYMEADKDFEHDIDSYLDDIVRLKALVEDMTPEVAREERYRSLEGDYEQRKGRLEDFIKELKEEMSDLFDEGRSKGHEIERLQGVIESMAPVTDARAKELIDQREEAKIELADANAMIRQLEHSYNAAVAESNELGRTSKRAKKHLKDCEDQRTAAEAQIKSLSQNNDTRARELVEQLEKANTELAAANAMMVSLRAARDAAVEATNELKKSSKDATEGLQDCIEQRTAAEAEIERLGQNNGALAAQTGVPQAALNDALVERDEAQRQVEKLEQDAEATIKGLQKEREACQESLKVEKQKGKEWKKASSTLEREQTPPQSERSNAPSPETPTKAKAIDAHESLKDFISRLAKSSQGESEARAVNTHETLKDFILRLASSTSGRGAEPRRSTRTTRNQNPDYDVGPAPRETRSRKRKGAKEEGSGPAKKKR